MRCPLVAASLLCLCGCSGAKHGTRSTGPDASQAPSISVGDDCVDALVDEQESLPDACSPEAACAQLGHEPERVVVANFATDYRLEADGEAVSLDDATRTHHEDCARRYAEALGIEARVAENIGAMWLQGPYQLVQRVLKLDWIYRHELSCADVAEGGCEQCWSRDEQTCFQDALCAPIRGSVVDETRSCTEARVAGCLPGNSVCPAAESFARAPDGTCFRFGGCVPRGFTVDESAGDAGAPRCDGAWFGNFLRCDP